MIEFLFVGFIVISTLTLIHYWYSHFGEGSYKNALHREDIASIEASLVVLRNAKSTHSTLLAELTAQLKSISEQTKITNGLLEVQVSLAKSSLAFDETLVVQSKEAVVNSDHLCRKTDKILDTVIHSDMLLLENVRRSNSFIENLASLRKDLEKSTDEMRSQSKSHIVALSKIENSVKDRGHAIGEGIMQTRLEVRKLNKKRGPGRPPKTKKD